MTTQRTDADLRAAATEAADVASTATIEAVEEFLQGELVLSSGIVLELRDVPPLALRQANLGVPLINPPMVYISDKGREEENPNDPVYLASVDERESIVYQAGVNVALVMGTACKSVPEGFVGPDCNEWVEQLEAAELIVDVSTPARRYLNWLHLYALRNAEDLRRTTYNALVRAGLMEAEVAAAAASFLSAARRTADRGRDAEGPGEDGDLVPPDDPGAGP